MSAIISENGKIINLLSLVNNRTSENIAIEFSGCNLYYIDLTTLFNVDRIEFAIDIVEKIMDSIKETPNYEDICFIVERNYSKTIQENLYYKIDRILSLEEKFNIYTSKVKSIVEMSEKDFKNLIEHINNNLFGNYKFKKRLEEELKKFRLFNKTTMQPVLSIFLCGPTGIGKTETARLIHNKLFANEKIIKINFGNYSLEHALSSLIGSPRGYIGSEKGELSEKLANSRSKIILIDEFEKASKPVFNFFLQLLEEGKFTDSLGREYDLDQYVIMFTSNVDTNHITKHISPELCSRFNLRYEMIKLTVEEKQKYLDYKVEEMWKSFKEKKIKISKEEIKELNVVQFNDLRKINDVIKNKFADVLYSKVFNNMDNQ